MVCMQQQHPSQLAGAMFTQNINRVMRIGVQATEIQISTKTYLQMFTDYGFPDALMTVHGVIGLADTRKRHVRP